MLRLVGAHLELLEGDADRLYLVRRAVHAVTADLHDIAAQIHAGHEGTDTRIQSDAPAWGSGSGGSTNVGKTAYQQLPSTTICTSLVITVSPL
jgi:hypothetical protein